MSDNYVGNVLGILRKLKLAGLPNNAVIDNIHHFAGKQLTDSESLRIVAYLHDQVCGSESVIKNIEFAEEARAGLLQTTDALKRAFTLGGMNSALSQYLPALDTSLSGFAILASITNSTTVLKATKELSDLIVEIENVKNEMDSYDLDPTIYDVVSRHINILLSLLNNVDAVGIDSALTAYAELMLRLRRLSPDASEKSKAGVLKIWTKIEQWAGRLTIIDHAITSGSNILQHFPTAVALIKHIPEVAGKLVG